VWLSTLKLIAPQRQEPSRRIGIATSSETLFGARNRTLLNER
jgi:hypothetical protein